jgi:hypothetical protein
MHEPKSLFIHSPMRSKVSCVVSFARRAGRVAAAVAVCGLLPLSEGSAQPAGAGGALLKALLRLSRFKAGRF